MSGFRREELPTDETRREPLPGIAAHELHELEIEALQERLLEVRGQSGMVGETMKRALALMRAQYRQRGWENVRLEEEGIDSDLDKLNGMIL